MTALTPLVLDAGVVIAVLDPDDAHHEWSVRVLRSLGPGRLMINALTLAEAVVHPAMAGGGDRAVEIVQRLEIDVVPVTEHDVLPLAQLRATAGLRMPDAVVLHTAIGCSAAVATTDVRLARAASERSVPLYAPFRVTTPRASAAAPA